MPHNEVGKIQRGRAKRLRGTMTRAETLLWRHLKAHRLSALGFRRQSPMGNYIADFVAHSRKLIVEVDGETHSSSKQLARDEERARVLGSLGFNIVRITNIDVYENLEGVREMIALTLGSI